MCTGSKINKIIFFLQYPFSKRDYERFGIEILEKNGFDVEVWDFAPFLLPEAHKITDRPDPINYERKRQFVDTKSAICAISGLSQNSFIVCILTYQFEALAIFKAISRQCLRYCIMTGVLPYAQSVKKDTIVETLKKIKGVNASKIKNQILARVPCKYLGVARPNFILASGGRLAANNFLSGSETEILWAHALDYDTYLKNKNAVSVNDAIDCVFLDEYVPFHPDYDFMKTKPYSEPEEYYPAMRRFLDFIENRYRIKVKIAAHPRSQYENYPGCFGDRCIVRGKTVELVKDAGFVIAHSSTSINFAILYKKPVVLITTDSLQRSVQGTYIEAMAKSLNKKIINIDRMSDFNLKEEIVIDDAAYNSYKDNYIKKNGSQEDLYWQIFSDRVKKF